MKRFILVILILGVFSQSFSSGSTNIDPLFFATRHLGFNLMPSANTSLASFGIVTVYEGKILKVEQITYQDFALQASGHRGSIANPEQKNLIADYGINTCGVYRDTINDKYVVNCDPMSNIWKLRYKEFPNRAEGAKEPGWSKNKFMPSEGQQVILQRYGIRSIIDFFWGDNAFRLLKDMEDPTWVNTYKSS